MNKLTFEHELLIQINRLYRFETFVFQIRHSMNCSSIPLKQMYEIDPSSCFRWIYHKSQTCFADIFF